MSKQSELMRKVKEMRNAIDAIEGALMGFGDLVDQPELWSEVSAEARNKVKITLPVTVAQMYRVTDALAECTRIINSEEYTVEALEVKG